MSARPGVPQASHRRAQRVDMSWQNHAACRDKNPRLFSDPALAHWGLQVCANCPVQRPCAELHPGDDEGVYGGRAHYPRRAIESSKASARTFMAHLARIRRSRGLSQVEVAKRMRVTDASVSMLESGRRTPSLDTLILYANAVGAELVLNKREVNV